MKLITFVAFVSTDLVCAWFVAPTVAADTAVAYHLTARPWKPLEVPASAYLDRVEGVVRFTLQHQNAAGSVIDPFTKAEHQYGTVYYAHAIGTLLHARRAKNLLDSGVRAMDFATAAFEKNETHGHRVFFITPLVESLELYAPLVPAEKLTTWRNRIKVKVEIEKAMIATGPLTCSRASGPAPRPISSTAPPPSKRSSGFGNLPSTNAFSIHPITFTMT